MEIYKNLSLEDLPNEEWRNVAGYEDLYQVSNLGRIKSLMREIRRGSGIWRKPNKILKPQLNGRGYHHVSLFGTDSKHQIKCIHQIVAEAFIENPDKYNCIDHINTDKKDNRASNLRWCNYKMNMNNPITKEKVDEIRASICRQDWYIDKQRFSQKQSKKVLQYDLKGTFIKEWRTISEAAREYNISVQSISRCCNGYVKTSMNYIWKFK